MYETISYENVYGNEVTIKQDETDFEVLLNGDIIMTTGDIFEAELVAESVNTALTVLNTQNRLLTN